MKKIISKGDEGRNFEETTIDTLNSGELAMDAKGLYKPTLKIYFSPELKASGVAASLKHLDEAIRAKFPNMIAGAEKKEDRDG